MDFLSSILGKSALGALAVGALVALAPASAEALTLHIHDLTDENNVVGEKVSHPETVTFDGSVGGFDIVINAASISSQGSKHLLNATSVEATGMGKLRITATEYGLTDFGAPLLSLFGTGSISDVGYSVMVRHFFKVGDTWTQVGNDINFLAAGGDSQSGDVMQTFATGVDGKVALRTIFHIESKAENTTSKVSSSLVAAVPLPAGGLLLLTALGGVAALRRKRKAA